MCQTENKRIKPKEDIVAYKIEMLSQKRMVGNLSYKTWISPMMLSNMFHGVLCKAEGRIKKKSIGAGAFHFWKTIEGAISIMKECGFEMLSQNAQTQFRIVKCIIPCEYNKIYVGKCRNLDSICAKYAIFTDEVIEISEKLTKTKEKK
jgi:hypothetical protein